MKQKPTYQKIIVYSGWILGGMLALGTFLDAVSNSLTLISWQVAIAGTVLLWLSWFTIQYTLRKNSVTWVISNNDELLITRMGPKFMLSFVGMTILLWIPSLIKLLPSTENQDVQLPPQLPVDIDFSAYTPCDVVLGLTSFYPPSPMEDDQYIRWIIQTESEAMLERNLEKAMTIFTTNTKIIDGIRNERWEGCNSIKSLYEEFPAQFIKLNRQIVEINYEGENRAEVLTKTDSILVFTPSLRGNFEKSETTEENWTLIKENDKWSVLTFQHSYPNPEENNISVTPNVAPSNPYLIGFRLNSIEYVDDNFGFEEIFEMQLYLVASDGVNSISFSFPSEGTLNLSVGETVSAGPYSTVFDTDLVGNDLYIYLLAIDVDSLPSVSAPSSQIIANNLAITLENAIVESNDSQLNALRFEDNLEILLDSSDILGETLIHLSKDSNWGLGDYAILTPNQKLILNWSIFGIEQ